MVNPNSERLPRDRYSHPEYIFFFSIFSGRYACRPGDMPRWNIDMPKPSWLSSLLRALLEAVVLRTRRPQAKSKDPNSHEERYFYSQARPALYR